MRRTPWHWPLSVASMTMCLELNSQVSSSQISHLSLEYIHKFSVAEVHKLIMSLDILPHKELLIFWWEAYRIDIPKVSGAEVQKLIMLIIS